MDTSISVDTGGTFTDGYMVTPSAAVRVKVDTTPHDLTVGILGCIDRGAEMLSMTSKELLQQTRIIRFSTTIGTNTLISRAGPKVGLLLGDSLVTDYLAALSEGLPLEPKLVAPITDRGDTPAPAEVSSSVHTLLERGARILVVALRSGEYLLQRERAVVEIITEDYPRHYLGAVPVLPSHQVSLTPDDVVRTNTAVMNAYLHPVMARLLYRVEDQLRADGCAYPLLVANADAGASRVAKTTAIRTWGSGPAGGVAGALEMAKELGISTVVTLDIGGTSSDISLIHDQSWHYTVQPVIDRVRVALPSVELKSIGFGGGSIARAIDGALTIGPDSAGAQPGPAAFGLGGTEATVTDAACCLGIFDPERFLGGRKRLDIEAAREAIRRNVADPLGLELARAAALVMEQGAAAIEEEIVTYLLGRGIEPRDAVLFATGGAGGLFAARVGRTAGMKAACAFSLNSVFSAFGLSTLDILHSYEAPAGGDLEAMVKELEARAFVDMEGEGVEPETVVFSLEAERVLPDGSVELRDLGSIARGQALGAPSHDLDQMSIFRLKASAPAFSSKIPAWTVENLPGPIGERAVDWSDGRPQATPLFDWDSLRGTDIEGPALVESEETTLLIPPGHSARVGSKGEVAMGWEEASAELGSKRRGTGDASTDY